VPRGHSVSPTLHEESTFWPIRAADMFSKVGSQGAPNDHLQSKLRTRPALSHAAGLRRHHPWHKNSRHGLASCHVAPLDLGNSSKDKDLTLQKGGYAIAGRMRSLTLRKQERFLELCS
jgi:hypothetical protein